jgi:hypothetical protein
MERPRGDDGDFAGCDGHLAPHSACGLDVKSPSSGLSRYGTVRKYLLRRERGARGGFARRGIRRHVLI